MIGGGGETELLASSSDSTIIFLVIVLISLQSVTLGVVLELCPWIQENELYTFLTGVGTIGGACFLAKEMFRYVSGNVCRAAVCRAVGLREGRERGEEVL